MSDEPEIDIFVPVVPKNVRKVRFHVRGRKRFVPFTDTELLDLADANRLSNTPQITER